MPIYEYRCPDCGRNFEEWVSSWREAERVRCPQCGEKNAERLVSPFASTTTASPSTSCRPGPFR